MLFCKPALLSGVLAPATAATASADERPTASTRTCSSFAGCEMSMFCCHNAISAAIREDRFSCRQRTYRNSGGLVRKAREDSESSDKPRLVVVVVRRWETRLVFLNSEHQSISSHVRGRRARAWLSPEESMVACCRYLD